MYCLASVLQLVQTVASNTHLFSLWPWYGVTQVSVYIAGILFFDEKSIKWPAQCRGKEDYVHPGT